MRSNSGKKIVLLRFGEFSFVLTKVWEACTSICQLGPSVDGNYCVFRVRIRDLVYGYSGRIKVIAVS